MTLSKLGEFCLGNLARRLCEFVDVDNVRSECCVVWVAASRLASKGEEDVAEDVAVGLVSLGDLAKDFMVSWLVSESRCLPMTPTKFFDYRRRTSSQAM